MLLRFRKKLSLSEKDKSQLLNLEIERNISAFDFLDVTVRRNSLNSPQFDLFSKIAGIMPDSWVLGTYCKNFCLYVTSIALLKHLAKGVLFTTVVISGSCEVSG